MYLFVIVYSFFLRIHAPFWFNLWGQHDYAIHPEYLKSIVELRYFKTYNAPYYYLILAVIGLPFSIAYHFHIISDTAFLHSVTYLSHDVFFLLIIAGMYLLLKELSFNKLETVAFIAMTVSSPVMQRSLNMIRPENFMLVAFIWLLLTMVRWWKHQKLNENQILWKDKNLWYSIFLLSFISAQKINGFVLLLSLLLISIFVLRGTVYKRFALMIKPTAVIIGFIVILLFFNYWFNHQWFFGIDNKDHKSYQYKAPLSFFTTFDPKNMYANPLRNNQKNSISGILLIDLYGDYWRYGTDFWRLDKIPPSRFKEFDHIRTRDDYYALETFNPYRLSMKFRKIRARLGLTLSFTFLIFFILCFLILTRRLFRKNGKQEIDFNKYISYFLSSIIFPSLLFIVLLCRSRFSPEKGDHAKWEYIVWVIPLFAFVPIGLLSIIRKRNYKLLLHIILSILMIGGLLQSTYLG